LTWQGILAYHMPDSTFCKQSNKTGHVQRSSVILRFTEKGDIVMPTRTADAEWQGNLQQGQGRMRLGSGAFEGNYSFRSRMGDGATGTNPEELIAAAHAGCFSMALSASLAGA
jgi:hypothetical protein